MSFSILYLQLPRNLGENQLSHQMCVGLGEHLFISQVCLEISEIVRNVLVTFSATHTRHEEAGQMLHLHSASFLHLCSLLPGVLSF